MLALHGYDTYGLDVSEKAVEAARRYAANELRDPSAYNFRTTSASNHLPEGATRGTATFLVGNFFEQKWEAHLAPEGEQKFDLIYDYTVSTDNVPRSRFQLANGVLVLMCSFAGHAPRLGASDE